MKNKRASWLLGVATAALLAAALQPASASQSTPPIEIGSFSGAYLAARVAEVDNDLDGAIAYYKTALAFDPDNHLLQQSLMLALISQGRFDESLPYATKLKDTVDIERFARLALAVDGFRRNDFKAAEGFLASAGDSDLDALVAKVTTAWALSGAGDHAAAAALLSDLQGPDWYSIFVSFHQALLAEAAGLPEQAEAAYASALEDVAAGSAAPDTWLRAAEAYAGFLARDGRKDAALAILDKAETFSPGRLPLTVLREKIGKGETVAPFVANASEGASELLLDLATALNRGGGEPYVRLYLHYALALKPDSDIVLVQLAGVAEQQQRAEEAIAFYRRVPEGSPLKRLSDMQLGLNLADLDRHDEAIKALSALVEHQPDDLRGYLALGGVHASKEDYASAAKVYDDAVKRIEGRRNFFPTNPKTTQEWNVYYQRGIAYERLKEWPKAEPNFRKALELYPDQPQVLNYLGYSWIDMNMNLDEGMAMIRKAVDLRPSDGYIVDSLGWAHYRLGQYEEAVRELERAVSLKPDDPVLNDHLGDAYWRVGRRLEATFQWSHARDLKPDADVLASVQKKLAEGLPPPADPKTAAEEPSKAPVPAVKAPAPAQPDKRSEAEPAVEEAKVVPAAYRVQPGQSLWSIAADELGSGSRYIEIIGLNPQLRGDPGRLLPGQELTLPTRPAN